MIIPTKAVGLDAAEAVKATSSSGFQEKNYRRVIPFAVLFTQTCPAIRPQTQASVESELSEQGMPRFCTQIHERAPYRAIFSFGGTLSGLDPKQVRGIDAAIADVRAFSNEVIKQLDEIEARRARVA